MPNCPHTTLVPDHIAEVYGVPAGSEVACTLTVGHEGMCRSYPLGETTTRMLWPRETR